MKMSGKLEAAVAVSLNASTAGASEEVVGRMTEQLGGAPDLVVASYTGDHNPEIHELTSAVQRSLAPDAFIGAAMAGVIGGAHEYPEASSMCLWGARLPGARVQAFELSVSRKGTQGFVRGWPDVGSDASCLLFAEPSTFPIDPFLHSLREGGRYPNILGGLAPETTVGPQRFMVDGVVTESGAIGIVMDGAARFEPVVAQGCWPVGPSFHITRCDRNVVFELDGSPAYEILSDLLRTLPEEESTRFRNSPHVGLKSEDRQEESGAGSYLVRNIVNLMSNESALAVAEPVEEGMQLRFHTRDALAAHRELENILSLASGFFPNVAGGLLFACAGRGIPLFGRPHHDSEMIQKFWPKLAVGGGFAAGEIGPLGGKPHIHAYTASLGLLVGA